MRYNQPNSPADQLRDFFLRGGVPVTLTILSVSVLAFLAGFFSPAARTFVVEHLAFNSQIALREPWTLLTYPMAADGFSIMLIITWVFFWLSGGSLERAWGSGRFAVFFFALTAISALSLVAGSALFGGGVHGLNDMFLPLTGLIVAFCMLNPEQTLVLYFFPVKAKYIALIVTAWTYFTYGSSTGSPILGLFALGGILAAFLYVRFGRSWADVGSYGGGARRVSRGPDLRLDNRPSTRPSSPRTYMDGSPTSRSPFDLAGRWRDRQESKRLEKLWKNSGFPSSDPERRDDEERRRR